MLTLQIINHKKTAYFMKAVNIRRDERKINKRCLDFNSNFNSLYFLYKLIKFQSKHVHTYSPSKHTFFFVRFYLFGPLVWWIREGADLTHNYYNIYPHLNQLSFTK